MDIIYMIDFVQEIGSQNYIVYFVSKVVLYNLMLLFVCVFVFYVKVNSVVFFLVMFNDDDSEEYCVEVFIKNLLGIVFGVQEVVKVVNYLFDVDYVIG